MIKFFLGFVLGIVVATHGVEGLVKMMDSGVKTIQDSTRNI